MRARERSPPMTRTAVEDTVGSQHSDGSKLAGNARRYICRTSHISALSIPMNSQLTTPG